MALVMNCTTREVSVPVGGSWFTFKPKQIKDLDENKAYFLAAYKHYEGFVSVPEKFSDLEYRSSEEGKKELATLEQQGIDNRIKHLQFIKHNEFTSLKKDMLKNNDHSDPKLEMSKATLALIEELAGYQQKAEAEKRDQVAKITELEKLLDK